MDAVITRYLAQVQIGGLQTFKNMGLAPLFTDVSGGADYVLLKEALENDMLIITEVDQSGSIPELKVVNTSPLSVLLLDGEELMGAKQNRVLNTSILLKGRSETVIPVSCTEQGRWRYTTDAFSHSDTMMSQKSRASKTQTVTVSLRAKRGYTSNQRRVWADIDKMLGKADVTSPTQAMQAVYAAKEKELREYLQAFPLVRHQRGSLVFINGKPAGLDLISREPAYEKLHARLVKSYAMDALLHKAEQFTAASIDKAKAFTREIEACHESRFESVGEGFDYRFEGPRVIGSALVVQNTVIHLAFFRLDEDEEEEGYLSSMTNRRDFRRSKR